MTALTPQLERTLTRPWSTAAALAALFVALEGLMGAVNMLVWVGSYSDEIDERLDILGTEWLRYLVFALVGLAAAYVLRLAARSEVTYAWPTLVLRAVILYVPVAIAITFVVAFIYALAHDQSFQFFGFGVLG
jgi:hypothetical protein